MKPAAPLSEGLTISALVAHLRERAPQQPRQEFAYWVLKLAWVVAGCGGAATVAAIAHPAWGEILGWIVGGCIIGALGLVILATSIGPLSLLMSGSGLNAHFARMSDQYSDVARAMAQEIADAHSVTRVREVRKMITLDMALVDRHKLKVAGVTALGAAAIALANEWGVEPSFVKTVQMVKQVMPALALGAASAWLAALGYQDQLERAGGVLDDADALMSVDLQASSSSETSKPVEAAACEEKTTKAEKTSILT